MKLRQKNYKSYTPIIVTMSEGKGKKAKSRKEVLNRVKTLKAYKQSMVTRSEKSENKARRVVEEAMEGSRKRLRTKESLI